MSPTRMASEHRWVYIGAIVILVALMVIGVIQYQSIKKTNDTKEKADQLSEQLVAAGFPAPDTGVVQRLLGTDGGIVCESPDDALQTALWKIQMSNGSGGPGQRPVISDTRAVEAERIVLQVYCPDQVDDFDEAVDSLKTDDTVRR
ncbi:hypothetical protein OG230_17145 [Streptomyces sp. NBC_00234]|uniref:hypothetical protein n=1 Tax=Streptomyces sp. NBC_00234 TaxID=2903638 RepID=UPI002E286232|nr:hypothetical protein [Streptomyces sp. NBC_00234]